MSSENDFGTVKKVLPIQMYRIKLRFQSINMKKDSEVLFFASIIFVALSKLAKKTISQKCLISSFRPLEIKINKKKNI